MSAQFGRWIFGGKPADFHQIEEADLILAPYGPDLSRTYRSDEMGILFRAFHTTTESRAESQPYITESGVVITWDGRLDNGDDIRRQLCQSSAKGTDVAVIAAAYERWEVNCLQRLVGDWAISIWDPRKRSLILAKDHVGTRHLFYLLEKDRFTWSTVLDPIVQLGGRRFELDKDYLAGWLSSYPHADLTPYKEIHSVPPACYVIVRQRSIGAVRYWNFDSTKRIQYRTDADYEEHFRLAFREAVRRRLKSDTPILAELSGGLDSSSIVCVADSIAHESSEIGARIDTVSYYDDAEPNWNERPYFTKIEEKRGRSGLHIDVAGEVPFIFDAAPYQFAATPQATGYRGKAIDELIAGMSRQGNRVILSGVGGDEVAGGVPTPIPELADLLAQGRLPTLGRRLMAWSLTKRVPWYQLLRESFGELIAPVSGSPSPRGCPVPWLTLDVTDRSRKQYRMSSATLLARPSFRSNLLTLDTLRCQLSCTPLSSPLSEYRYPFLDRDLLEFLYAIPREQLVRPGQRRSLMRRAMTGIVPEEVLNRKRKAFVVRAPTKALTSNLPAVLALTKDMQCKLFGLVDATAFATTLRAAERGEEVAITNIIRTLLTEIWLRRLPPDIFERPSSRIISAPSVDGSANPERTARHSLFQLRQNPPERR